MALNRARCLAAAFGLSLVGIGCLGIGCSGPDKPTPQAWAEGEVHAINTLQYGSGRLYFALPSLKNAWAMEHLTDAGVAALLAHDGLPPLESLDFMGVNITAATVRSVVASPKTLPLESLRFSFAPLGDSGLEAVAGWPALGTLKLLAFDKTGATAVGLEALASGPYGQDMPALSLKWQPLGNAGAEVLSTMKFRGLLSVKDSGIRGAGARGLIERAPSASITLEENPIGPGGLVGLKVIGKGLRGLFLSNSGLSGEDAAALSALPSTSLTSLDLSYCDLGDLGVSAIAQAPWLSSLDRLDLGYTGASPSAYRAVELVWGDREGLSGVPR
jgi:hypothetical protein